MGSTLVIHDIETGAERIVLDSGRLIEAPNWSPDGRFLVVNGDGLLYRVDLADPALVEIDTGFVRACNNDHGISRDGQSLVISNSPRPLSSCIYQVPISGGTPRKITENTPSWWHGWSPDGAEFAYAARRDGKFCIAVCPADGGAEKILIGQDGAHYDGPDYSPDGKYIWFNSDRGGAMQLWRMGRDGSGASAMTDDERVNWFPHPSPDGRHVLYLAYAAGTEGHPRGRDVELRLMNLADGSIRTLVSLYGGQGSINVPCWAPDGKQFAYMRYSRD